jgi:hypothetical protein
MVTTHSTPMFCMCDTFSPHIGKLFRLSRQTPLHELVKVASFERYTHDELQEVRKIPILFRAWCKEERSTLLIL